MPQTELSGNHPLGLDGLAGCVALYCIRITWKPIVRPAGAAKGWSNLVHSFCNSVQAYQVWSWHFEGLKHHITGCRLLPTCLANDRTGREYQCKSGRRGCVTQINTSMLRRPKHSRRGCVMQITGLIKSADVRDIGQHPRRPHDCQCP
jgi:hypothetical protein